jgi:hypothetical protein
MIIKLRHFRRYLPVILIFFASLNAYTCDFIIEFCLNFCNEPKSISDSTLEQVHLREFTNSSIFENSFDESSFEGVPKEIFYAISNDIKQFQDSVNLSKVSKKFRQRSIEFWENFLKKNMLIKWDPLFPAIKIAYAYKMFDEKNIYLAAKLGLPRAISLRNTVENKKKIITLQNPILVDSLKCGTNHKNILAKFSTLIWLIPV